MQIEDRNFKNLTDEFKNYILSGVNDADDWYDAIADLSDSEYSDPIFSYYDSDSISDSSVSESWDSINDTVPFDFLIDTVSTPDISENESE